MNCKHSWERSGHINDLICTKCGYAAMQASIQIQTPIVQPIMRKKTSVPIYDGKKTVMVSVYKDELDRQFKKSLGLDITQNIMKSSLR